MKNKIEKVKVKPLQMELIFGMANYDFNPEGWQDYKTILNKSKFTSQETNFGNYITPLIKEGIVEKKWLKYKDNRNRKHKKNQYRLKRDPESFCKTFLIFFDKNIVPLFFDSNYYQDLQEYMMANIPKGLRDEFQLETSMFPDLYAYRLLEGDAFQNKLNKVNNLINKHYPGLNRYFINLSFAIVSYMSLLFDDKEYPYSEPSYSERLEILRTYIDNKLRDFKEREALFNKLKNKKEASK